MDLDGREDIISCWIGGRRLGFYKNVTSSTPAEDVELENISIYIIGNSLYSDNFNSIDRLYVYSSSGQLILDRNPFGVLDISTLANGTYIYHALSKDKSYFGKFYKLN
ncbi:MAG: T9SS type A sorting domain-containing protein [Bacteroidota bacterium]